MEIDEWVDKLINEWEDGWMGWVDRRRGERISRIGNGMKEWLEIKHDQSMDEYITKKMK